MTSRPPPGSHGPRQPGFTLIELLVVITIVAVLAGMLMPALQTVRSQARNTQCRGNLRMCTLAVLTYTNDNDGMMPYLGDGSAWYNRSSPYLDDAYQSTLYSGNNVYHCPFAEVEIRNQWKAVHRFSFHFGMNQKVYGKYNPLLIRPIKGLSAIRSQCVMLGDGKLFYFGPLAYFGDELADKESWPIAGQHSLPSTFAGVPARIDLHGGVVNLSYMDGHVSPVVGTWTAAEATLWNP